MPSALRETLRALADRFVNDVLAALSRTLDTEIFERAEPAPALAPRQRRRRIDLASVSEQIAGALEKSSGGVRAEELRRAVGLDKATFVRGVRHLISVRRVRKTGLRRDTRYFAVSAAAKAPATKKKTAAATQGKSAQARKAAA